MFAVDKEAIFSIMKIIFVFFVTIEMDNDSNFVV